MFNSVLVSVRASDIENSDVHSIECLLEKAGSAGFHGVYCDYHPRILEALKRGREQIQRRKMDICPIVPNVSQYVRDISSGIIYAGLKRLSELSFNHLVFTLIKASCNPGGIVNKDFRVLFPLMLEMELGGFASYNPPTVFLHAQMTDLLCAMGGRELFAIYANIVSSRYQAEPALETNNLHALVSKLDEWGLKFSVISAPLNNKGHMMKPSKVCYEQLIASTGSNFRFLARNITTGGSVSFRRAIEYVKDQKVHGMIIDSSCEDMVMQCANILGLSI